MSGTNTGPLCFCICTLYRGTRVRGYRGKGGEGSRSAAVFLLPLSLRHANHLLGSDLPVFLVVDDNPAPGPMFIQANKPASVVIWSPALRVWAFEVCDRPLNNVQRDPGSPRDAVRRHIDDPVRAHLSGELQEVFEYVPDLPVGSYRRIKNLLKNFGEHHQAPSTTPPARRGTIPL